MSLPTRAGEAPIAIELEAGKNYAWCSCGESSKQPFCDGSHAPTEMRPTLFKAEKSGTHYLCACKATGNGPFCDGSHTQKD